MATETTTLPQNIAPIKTVTLKQIIDALPKEIPFKVNVWITGKVLRDGQMAEPAMIFMADMETEPSIGMRQYFDSLMQLLGIAGTITNGWRNYNLLALRVYNEGRLVVNKEGQLTELPTPTVFPPVVPLEYVLSKLPKTIPFLDTIWMVGGMVKNGWSSNDVDFMIFEKVEPLYYATVRDFFVKALELKVHVGGNLMPDREPIYKYKLYENGTICLP